MGDSIEVHGQFRPSLREQSRSWNQRLTWGQIFGLIAPHLLTNPADYSVKNALPQSILKLAGIKFYDSTIEDHEFQTIKIQLKAYGLIELQCKRTEKGDSVLFWSLTEKGKAEMMQLRTIRAIA